MAHSIDVGWIWCKIVADFCLPLMKRQESMKHEPIQAAVAGAARGTAADGRGTESGNEKGAGSDANAVDGA